MKRATLAVLAFIFCLALSVRLIAITQPFVDHFSWRQADVAMIAENFYRGGYDILHPQINWSADTTGVVGTEFPFLPFLAALLYKVFGIQEWIGRGISVAFFMLSIPFFFLLIAKLSNFETGLLASVFYSFTPLGIFTSRSFIPDPMSLSLAVIGLYYFLTWTDSMRFAHLALAASAVSGAILVKAPYAMILAPIAYLSIRRYGRAAVRVKALWFFAVVAILPAVVWYSHALAIPTATPTLAGKPHFFGEQGVGFASTRDVSEVVERNFWYYFTPVTGVLSVAGLVLFWRESHRGKMFHYLLIAMIVFVVVVGPGNRMHPWYQLPLLPVTSAFAAGGLDYVIRRLPARLRVSHLHAIAGLALVAVLGCLSYYSLRDDYGFWNPGCIAAARRIDQTAPAEARVLITDKGDPSCLYYAKRKGWHFWNPKDDTEAIESLERYRELGAGYLIMDEYHLWWLGHYKDFAAYLKATYPESAVTKRYAIFDLTRPPR